MFITTIEIKNGSTIESLESWDGDTEKESVDRAIKSAEEQNISANSIISITTKSLR